MEAIFAFPTLCFASEGNLNAEMNVLRRMNNIKAVI
jgi:hypothetical protein